MTFKTTLFIFVNFLQEQLKLQNVWQKASNSQGEQKSHTHLLAQITQHFPWKLLKSMWLKIRALYTYTSPQ